MDKNNSKKSNKKSESHGNTMTYRRSVVENSSELQFGYVEVNGALVPLSFLTYLSDCCDEQVVEYGKIIDPCEIVGKKNWKAFDQKERELAPACLHYLIEYSGLVPISFKPGNKFDF